MENQRGGDNADNALWHSSSSYCDNAQLQLSDAISNVNTWKAVLPFAGIVGYTGEVDLFQFIVGKQREDRFAAKFNPEKWPPTNAGLKTLLRDIEASAFRHGTSLNINKSQDKGVLICAFAREYRNNDAQKEFDSDGIRKDIRGKRYHNDRLCNRPNGIHKPRQTSS